MRLENLSAQDPRRVLCERKYFGMRPQPLEQHLYALNLSQCAERVFWLHWDAGYLRGDFTSEIAISEVARRVRANSSTVTRAYQTLKLHGLIRRQDPGRDPSQPFCQAMAVTEVTLPRDALQALLGSPDRMMSAGNTTTDRNISVRKDCAARAAPEAPIPKTSSPMLRTDNRNLCRRCVPSSAAEHHRRCLPSSRKTSGQTYLPPKGRRKQASPMSGSQHPAPGSTLVRSCGCRTIYSALPMNHSSVLKAQCRPRVGLWPKPAFARSAPFH